MGEDQAGCKTIGESNDTPIDDWAWGRSARRRVSSSQQCLQRNNKQRGADSWKVEKVRLERSFGAWVIWAFGSMA